MANKIFAPLINAHYTSKYMEEILEAYDGNLGYISFEKQCGQNTVSDANFS